MNSILLCLLGGEVPWWQTILALLVMGAIAAVPFLLFCALVYGISATTNDRLGKQAERDQMLHKIERNTR